MEKVVHPHSGGDSRGVAVWLPRRPDREAAVERPAAAALRVAPHHLLAGAWTAGAVPDPLRRTGRPRLLPLRRASAAVRPRVRTHDRTAGRTHGSDDAGRTGAIPTADPHPPGFRSTRRRDQDVIMT